MEKHIITIAGKPASGKSTASKNLAAALSYTHYSTGDFFREIGREMGLDVMAMNKTAETMAEIDHRVDERQKQLGETEDNFIIDARLGWFFIPNSFKVYLNLDSRIAAGRILSSMDEARKASEHIPDDAEEYAKVLDERLQSESGRYKNLYNADPSNMQNYDLVVDTGVHGPEEVKRLIIEAYEKWLADK